MSTKKKVLSRKKLGLTPAGKIDPVVKSKKVKIKIKKPVKLKPVGVSKSPIERERVFRINVRTVRGKDIKVETNLKPSKKIRLLDVPGWNKDRIVAGIRARRDELENIKRQGT